jgi:hypothetical protein
VRQQVEDMKQSTGPRRKMQRGVVEEEEEVEDVVP